MVIVHWQAQFAKERLVYLAAEFYFGFLVFLAKEFLWSEIKVKNFLNEIVLVGVSFGSSNEFLSKMVFRNWLIKSRWLVFPSVLNR